MKQLIVAAAFALLSAAPAAGQTEAPSQTDVVRSVLETLGPAFVESDPPPHAGMFTRSIPIPSMRLATQPRSARSPGLCEATIATIQLTEPKFGASRPIQTQTVFKVVGLQRSNVHNPIAELHSVA